MKYKVYEIDKYIKVHNEKEGYFILEDLPLDVFKNMALDYSFNVIYNGNLAKRVYVYKSNNDQLFLNYWDKPRIK